MEQVGSFLTQFATKEVFTILTALVTAWIGWKTASKVGGYTKAFYQKANFRRLAATGLLFVGASGLGLGIGEWQSRDAAPVANEEKEIGMNNQELQELLDKSEDRTYSGNSIASILEYVKERDQAQLDKEKSEQLVVMRGDKEVAFLPTSYKEETFEITEAPGETAINEESMVSTQMAWISFMLGTAALIASFVLYQDSDSDPKDRTFS